MEGVGVLVEGRRVRWVVEGRRGGGGPYALLHILSINGSA